MAKKYKVEVFLNTVGVGSQLIEVKAPMKEAILNARDRFLSNYIEFGSPDVYAFIDYLNQKEGFKAKIVKPDVKLQLW